MILKRRHKTSSEVLPGFLGACLNFLLTFCFGDWLDTGWICLCIRRHYRKFGKLSNEQGLMKSDLWQERQLNEISVERLFGCSVEALSMFGFQKYIA